MTDIYIIFVAFPLVFISALILILSYFTKREDPSNKYFLFLCGAILSWNILQILSKISSNISVAEFIYSLQMLVIPYIPVALLMFTLKLTGFEKYTQAKYVILLSILPTATVILNLTNDFHYLFRIDFAIIELTPVRVFINERGPWFWVHTAYSYAAIVLACFATIYKLKRTVKAARFRFYMVLVGCSLSIFSNIFVLLFAPASPIDSTLWGVTFGLFFLYFVMDTSPSSHYILARNQVFESIDEYIFVLDINNNITDINTPARKWLEEHNINADPTTKDTLFNQLEKQGAKIEKDENDELKELFFLDDKNLLFSSFFIKKSVMCDKNNAAVGTILTFSDMTAAREAIRNLRQISIIDPLTGTYNRRAYEKTLADYDNAAFLPLCVIIGDVNGLKKVNDTLGHAIGDLVLKQMAQILVRCTSGNGAVARIGGDEFAIIIPEYDKAAAKLLIAQIKETVAVESSQMHGAGIALGYAIKTEKDQELSKIIDNADKKMYKDKDNDRRAREL